jgi:hypothetical protein
LRSGSQSATPPDDFVPDQTRCGKLTPHNLACPHGTAEIVRQAGVAETAVWLWQERYMRARVEGLLRDKTRPSPNPAAAAGGR